MGKKTKKINIGISLFIRKEGDSIFSNGIKQNVLMLYKLLKQSKKFNEIYIINVGDGDDPSLLMMDDVDVKVVRFDDVQNDLDFLIELGAQTGHKITGKVRENGGKVVAYKGGNDFWIDTERTLFQQKPGAVFIGVKYDEIWTTPQHMNTNYHYFRLAYDAPVKEVPHIWDSFFIDKIIGQLKKPYDYQPGKKRWNFGVFEPNINMLKTCHYPMLILEDTYRHLTRQEGIDPEEIKLGDIYITNAVKLKEREIFTHFANTLDIVKTKKASFESRYKLPWFISEYIDAVVSWQHENGLNYLWYDVLYGGYPLIHNSPFIKDAGYYYEGFNVEDGKNKMLEAFESHDDNLVEYKRAAKEVIWEHQAINPKNVEYHENLILELYESK